MSRLEVGAWLAEVLVVLLAPQGAWARDISFVEAREAAAREAPDVQIAQQRRAIANTEVDVAGTLANPTLTLATAHQTAKLGTALALPLPLFGQRSTSIRAARADADAVALDANVVRRESRWAASITWIDLWEAQLRSTLLQSAAQDSDRLFRIASERFGAGTGSRLDVVRSKAGRSQAAAEAEAASRLVAAAAARLVPLIGATLDADLTAAGAPVYPAETTLAIDVLEQRLPDHPTLRRDRAQVVAAQSHVQNELRLRAPILTPQLTLNQFDPTLPGPDVIVGLSFDLPVLNLRGGAIARARAIRSLAELTAALDERRLHADLLDAYRRTEAAQAEWRAFREEVLPAMEEAETMTEEGYRLGRVDLVRLLEAQRAFLDSRLAAAAAQATWARAVADLEKAAGLDFGRDGAHAQ